MSKRSGFLLVALCALLVACQPPGPPRTFNKGEELLFVDFTRADSFEQGVYENASLLIRDGVYRIDLREGDNELWWGQWGDIYEDVIIDVDADLLSNRPEVAYGVMCRLRGRVGLPIDTSDLDLGTPSAELIQMGALEATEAANEDAGIEEEATTGAGEALESALEEDEDTQATTTAEAPDEDVLEATAEETAEATDEQVTVLDEVGSGDGYLFLVQGGGSAGIFRARGRSLVPLADWRTSEAIQPPPATNQLRAVCAGDYLAFYINDVLVAEATDDTYERGQVGLAASAANRLGARVEFDNLTISEAEAG